MEQVEGRLHILRVDAPSSPVAQYIVMFAPKAPAGSVRDRRCHGQEALRKLLQDVGIETDKIDEAVDALSREGDHEIPRVLLAPDRVKALGL